MAVILYWIGIVMELSQSMQDARLGLPCLLSEEVALESIAVSVFVIVFVELDKY